MKNDFLDIDWNHANNPVNKSVMIQNTSFISEDTDFMMRGSKNKGRKKKFNLMESLKTPVLVKKQKEREVYARKKLSMSMCISPSRNN